MRWLILWASLASHIRVRDTKSLAPQGTVLVKSKQDIKRLQEGGGVLGALEACAWPIADQEVADVSVDE